MKKLLFVLLTFTLSIQNFYAQCYPVFSQMPKQRLNTLPFTGDVGYHKTFYYAISGFDFLTYDIWNGKNWNLLKLPADIKFSKGSSISLTKLNGTYVGYGRISSFNNMHAPKGKYFGFIRYKNGVWDTLPGCIVDSANYYTSNLNGGISTDHNLYAFDRAAVGKVNVYKYDTTKSKFIKIADLDDGRFGPNTRCGSDRLLLGGIKKINGLSTIGFATIDGDSIKINSDGAFNEEMIYEIDKSNDHVFACDRAVDPIVLEYSDQLIQIRKTKIETPLSDLLIFNGTILSFNRVLCPGETNWKFASMNDASNPVSTKDGIFGLHAQSRKVLELTTGAKISGMAYMDLDSNCSRDTLNEPLLKGKEVNAISDKFIARGITDKNGKFEFYVTLDSFKLQGPGPSSSCTNGSVITNSLGKDYTMDIPVLKPTKYDLRVKLLNGYYIRWNSNIGFNAVVENMGLPYDSAYFEFKLDPKLKFLAGDSNISYSNGTTYGGKLKNLDYFDKRLIRIVAWVDSSKTKRDSILCTSFSSYLYTTENNLTDNSDNICQTVVYSLDPNHKECNKEIIPKTTSTKLDYFIAFQNEGNDYAEDVVVIDTLSAMVSLETLEIIGASHPYNMTLNGKVLTITFKKIFLKPKNQNEQLSQGFFKFSINTVAGLKRGDKILNTAFIYFDLNQPVITNTSVVVVEKDIASIKNETSYKNILLAYPNPTQGILHITTSNEDVIQVYSVTGELLYTGKTENGILDVDMTTWTGGLYLVRSGSLSSKVLKTE